MKRSIFLFLATFVAGALLALVVRAAMFNPHTGHEVHAGAGGEYKPLVRNALTPATQAPESAAAAKPTPAATEPGAKASDAGAHGNHGSVAPATEAKRVDAGTPVNTVCAICGMPVDPKVPTAEYQGKTIGFGCRMCPPKFKAEPDRWGPLYLKNEVAKRD